MEQDMRDHGLRQEIVVDRHDQAHRVDASSKLSRSLIGRFAGKCPAPDDALLVGAGELNLLGGLLDELVPNAFCNHNEKIITHASLVYCERWIRHS